MKKIVTVLFVLGTIGLIFALAGCKNPAGGGSGGSGGSGGEDAIVLTIECYQADGVNPATDAEVVEISASFPGGTVSGTIITYTQSQFETMRTNYVGVVPNIIATSTPQEFINAFVAEAANPGDIVDLGSQKMKVLHTEG